MKGKSKNQKVRTKKYRKKGLKLTKKSDVVVGNMQLINASRIGGKAPIPRRYMCKLHYSDVFNMAGGGALGVYSKDQTFRLNSCYDVDLTNAGHQPRYFDELSVLYTNHRVIGTKITVSAIPTASDIPSQNIWIGVVANNTFGSMQATSYADFNERPFSITKQGNLYVGAQQLKIVMKHKTKSVLGVKSVMYGDEFAGTVASNPTRQCYYHVLCGSLDQSTSWSARVKVDIEQIVVFENQDTPAQS